MIAFTFSGQPAAYGSGNYRKTRKVAYQQAVQKAFRAAHPDAVRLTGDLYGIVLYFTKRRNEFTDPDADNISKPIWDSLTQVAYADDRQIRWRASGVVNLREIELTELELDSLPTDILNALEDFVLTTAPQHLLYIHLGALQPQHYRFQL